MKRFSLIVFLLVILLFTACSNGPSASATSLPSKSTEISQTVSPSAQPSTTVTEHEPPEEENPYLWEYLPGSVPEISDDDFTKFNPEMIVDYLASVGQHSYRIAEAQINGGQLLLTIEDSRYIFINDAYEFLTIDLSLTDDEILDIPIFSECIIKDEEMYVNKDEYEHLQAEDDFYDDYGIFNIDTISLGPIPVSDDAKITLYDNEDSENYELTAEEFEAVVSTLIASDSLNDMYFKYEDGEITGIFQGDEVIF